MKLQAPLIAALAAAGTVGCGAGHVYTEASLSADQVVISQAPPPPRVEVAPPPPMPDAVWVPGFWSWSARGSTWAWVPGRYEVRRGYVWVPPRYQRRGGGWVYLRGHWRPRRP